MVEVGAALDQIDRGFGELRDHLADIDRGLADLDASFAEVLKTPGAGLGVVDPLFG